MNRDFARLLWLFNSPRETRDIIRLDLHEAGLLYKYASQQWKILPKTREDNIREARIGEEMRREEKVRAENGIEGTRRKLRRREAKNIEEKV